MKKNFIIIFLFVLIANCRGQVTFQKTLGGINFDYGQSIQQTTDEGYIVAGYTGWGTSNSDVYLIKTDSSGNLYWTRTFGGTNEDYGEEVRQTTGLSNMRTNNKQKFVGHPLINT